MPSNKPVSKMDLSGGAKPEKVIKLYHGSPNKIVHPTYGMVWARILTTTAGVST